MVRIFKFEVSQVKILSQFTLHKNQILLTVDSVFKAFNASIYINSYCSNSEMSTFMFFTLVLPAEFKTLSNSSFCKEYNLIQ